MKYVSIYGNAMSTVLPHPDMYAKNVTFRYPVFVPFKGSKYQIKLDNYCGNEKVVINKVTVGKGKSLSSDVYSDFITLKVNGKEEFEMEAHGSVISDEFYIDVEEDEYLIVSMYVKDFTNLTSGVDIKGPLSKGYYGIGDMSEDKILDINKSKSISWYYFLSDIYAYTDDTNKAIICYGDSITSQDWPDYTLLSLREKGIKNISIIRKAVSGTRILRQYECITYQSYGLKGENRFVHEISSVKGSSLVIIQHGINDIIHPVGEEVNIFRPRSDLPSVEEMIEGIKYYQTEANKLEIESRIGTLLPIYNWRTYAPFREELKNDFNKWILSLDKSIDFNNSIGDLIDDKWHFKDGCDSGDHLHPSSKAYEIMGRLASEEIMK